MGQSQTKQVKQPTQEVKHTTRKDGKIRFAVLGNSGVGKSAFINAIRGVKDDDEGAAEVGVTLTTIMPTEYPHPNNPMIIFVEIPSIGTPHYPDFPIFFEKVRLEDYDIFLLFTAGRFTQYDLQMAAKLHSIGKLFFFIRTKIDVIIRVEKRKREFDEEKIEKIIREDYMKNVKYFISSENEIFLISSWEPHKWDFGRLHAAIINVLPVHQRECLIQKMTWSLREETESEESEKGEETEREEKEREETEREETEDTQETADLTEEYLADARAYINKNGVSGIGEFLKKKLDEWKNIKIRFGITGDSGTGKSTFINAIRGLEDDDYENDAAEVGVTETTREPKEYTYPANPMITLVDLPGIGTPNYPDLPTYCEKVDLEKYDTFLIFTADRFTQYDLVLAKKVKSLGKSFFLIRTKIDEALRSHRGKARIDKEVRLRKIRIYCMDNVKGMISSEKEIFLIGNYDKEKWDFDRLVKTIGRALPIVQREGLILSLSDLTRGCLNRKAMFLKARAVAVATISARNGVIPIPGWGAVLDAKLIRDTIEEYHIRLGLHDITSDTFEEFNKYEKVLQIYKFQSDEELLLSLNSESHGLRKVQEVSKYIPILGTIIAGSISFVLMSRYLERCVDELEVVALAVWDDAAKRSTENDSETSTDNSHTH